MSPSGITADIYEGKPVTLRDYLMRVGRQMGFAVLQRDDDPDDPVRPISQSSSYYERRIQELEQRLGELRRMTISEARDAAKREYEESRASWEKTKAEKEALWARYEAMLLEVEAWEPDPLILSTKENAIRYLRESIEFDVSRGGEDPMRYYPEPHLKAADIWLREELENAESELERAKKYLAEERARVAERNEYIAAFLRSLPPEEKN